MICPATSLGLNCLSYGLNSVTHDSSSWMKTVGCDKLVGNRTIVSCVIPYDFFVWSLMDVMSSLLEKDNICAHYFKNKNSLLGSMNNQL